ncbi:unnamed protein product [Thelazia callipaeda]|uniref:MTOR-associated protein MEAK7 n=1 Tax=Thelazia callipaeda TaxID=103827 RepID=A0A0N5D5I4_THECL|nr:unnamed protein product [Thelazia callipaeda]
MGKALSKANPSHVRKNDNGSDALQKRFYEISNGNPNIDKVAFQKFTTTVLSPQMQSIIYDALQNKENVITEKTFIKFAKMMLGDKDQQAEALIQFNRPVEEILDAIVSSFFMYQNLDLQSGTLLTDYFMQNMPPALNVRTLSNFIKREILLQIMIAQTNQMLHLVPGSNFLFLPETCKHSILTSAALCLLYANLPENLRAHWKLIFSSVRDGESFTQLLKNVSDAGPCLIVIETASNRVFGGFADQGFTSGPLHTGDTQCFLFQDRQKLNIYHSTGYNKNFCYINTRQASMPNGIGMGGYDDNWSFFVDEDLRTGNSTPGMSTFEKCWLAEETTYMPKTIEIWQIGERWSQAEDMILNEIVRERTLTNKREARAVLELSGKELRGDIFKDQKKFNINNIKQ